MCERYKSRRTQVYYSLRTKNYECKCLLQFIKNKIFSHIRIIVHKMTVLIFHVVERFLDLSENINLKEKKSKSC